VKNLFLVVAVYNLTTIIILRARGWSSVSLNQRKLPRVNGPCIRARITPRWSALHDRRWTNDVLLNSAERSWVTDASARNAEHVPLLNSRLVRPCRTAGERASLRPPRAPIGPAGSKTATTSYSNLEGRNPQDGHFPWEIKRTRSFLSRIIEKMKNISTIIMQQCSHLRIYNRVCRAYHHEL